MIQLECTCDQIIYKKWLSLMKDRKRFPYKKLVKLIKKELPDLYESLSLNLMNPWQRETFETNTHYILTHSATEYFINKGVGHE